MNKSHQRTPAESSYTNLFSRILLYCVRHGTVRDWFAVLNFLEQICKTPGRHSVIKKVWEWNNFYFNTTVLKLLVKVTFCSNSPHHDYVFLGADMKNLIYTLICKQLRCNKTCCTADAHIVWYSCDMTSLPKICDKSRWQVQLEMSKLK